jgi:phosphogluconate dehydratase
LQGKGFKVALVTDGRMSGASGKVPAAIHVSPEVLAGGPLGKVRTGDIIRLNSIVGTLNALVDSDEWEEREQAELSDHARHDNSHGLGRDLFGAMRRNVHSPEEGAVTWF